MVCSLFSVILKYSSWHGSAYKMVASLARQLMLELKHMWNACTSLRSVIRSQLSALRFEGLASWLHLKWLHNMRSH